MRMELICAHEVLDLLPTTTCMTPEKSIRIQNQRGFDEQVLLNEEWQRVLQYLDCTDKQDKNYNLTPVRNPQHALDLLLRYCGLTDPTWAELRHFVSFFNDQLRKSEKSPFCHHDFSDDLPGFTQFVVTRMLEMSKDFATRSLTISEETPDKNLMEIVRDDNVLQELEMKNRWENSPHPYLFFNEDGDTFTPLGFHVNPHTLQMIDSQTGYPIDEQPCMERGLHTALRGYQFELDENYDKMDRERKIEKLCGVLGNDKPGNQHDPNPNYELTMDNAKKILAIHQRLRVNIPVIIMGETGCGKTELIRFMSQLQIPEPMIGNKELQSMMLMKIHGGTTEQQIKNKVTTAMVQAQRNREICPQVYTILFLDEANTTEAIGLIKEILCDGSMMGEPLDDDSGLKIIAACNPYRKHSDQMIEKLKKAGLGYNVDESETSDKFGQIPMRHLVYRVQALSQSLLPLVWDFGTLSANVEQQYIRQMIVRSERREGGIPLRGFEELVAKLFCVAQQFMRGQEDECSFVSLRDVNRTLEVMRWFYDQSDTLLAEMGFYYDEDFENENYENLNVLTLHSLMLSVSVCYTARLEPKTRQRFADTIGPHFEALNPTEFNIGRRGSVYMTDIFVLCQNTLINAVVAEVDQQHTNIAKNNALKENVLMMIVCIENRIPLFVVGKPGSSKSLSKALIQDAMKGDRSTNPILKNLKWIYTVSFQCSRHATADNIIGVFNSCANLQKDKSLTEFVSVVVLDEVGLAEDSDNMPLKALHPLLEDGCVDSRITPEDFMKCGFVGISNWALDPAKMNRGIFVQRGTPEPDELELSARGICQSSTKGVSSVSSLIKPLAQGYLKICEDQTPERRGLTEFYGLRDFYSLIKMVVNFAETNQRRGLYQNQLEHSIRRNFGGFDTCAFDPMETFTQLLPGVTQREPGEEGKPPCDPIGLIKTSLTGEYTATNGIESRYLLVLTENMMALNMILDELSYPEVVFGSCFPRDNKYTQICRNINRIKSCMEMGQTVILLNLDDLYESLYDALNQYFTKWGKKKFVDIGLGTHRVKSLVHDKFRLVVVADKNKVYDEFPIPMINRLEKHYMSVTTLLTEQQKDVKQKLKEWAEKFVKPNQLQSRVCPENCDGCQKSMDQPFRLHCGHYIGDCCRKIDMIRCPVIIKTTNQQCTEEIPPGKEWEVDTAGLNARRYFHGAREVTSAFIGYSEDVLALTVRKAWTEQEENNEKFERAKEGLLRCATWESVLRLNATELQREAEKIKDIYMSQNHDSLLGYLETSLGENSTLIQVTTFATLLSLSDKDNLSKSLQESRRLEISMLSLEDYDTEEQFTKDVRIFYKFDESLESGGGILLLQCEAAYDRIDLLDSVRYIIQREREQSRKNDRVSPVRHVVLLIHVPRGKPFKGYQGGDWECAHVDDPRIPSVRLPKLFACLNLKPSEILAKIRLLSEKLEQKRQEEEEEDHSMEEEEDEVKPIDTSEKENLQDFDGMRFLFSCIPAAVSRIGDGKEMRAHILRGLLQPDTQPGFTVLVLEFMYNLLSAEESNKYKYNWVTSDAVSANTMKHAETMKRSLEFSLERIWSRALAAVIAFVDRNDNLDLLQDDYKIRFWLDMFLLAPHHGLDIKDLAVLSTEQNNAGNMRLPESYRPPNMSKENAPGYHIKCPFSWIIKEVADNLLTAARKNNQGQDSDTMIDQAHQVFMQSPVGQVLQDHSQWIEEVITSYQHDFVYMVHPCSSPTEHEIVSQTIQVYCEKKWGPGLHTPVQIHSAYEESRSSLESMSHLLKFDPEIADAVLKELQERQNTESDKASLFHLLENLNKTGFRNIKEDPRIWSGRLAACKIVVQEMLDQPLTDDGSIERMEKCRTLWLKLCIRKLYLDYIVLPSGKGFKYRALKELLEKSDGEFKRKENFDGIVSILRSDLRHYICQVHGKVCPLKCPGCERDMDSPVKLPCKHFVCDLCVNDLNMCPSLVCGQPIPDDFEYQLNVDASSSEHGKLVKYRQCCNQFMMRFVAEIVFSDDECPDEEVLEELFTYVSAGDKTRQFSLYNCHDVIDPTPVLRSFLLKLLLKTPDASYFVENYFSNLMRTADIDDQKCKICRLFIDCKEDMRSDIRKEDTDSIIHAIHVSNFKLEISARTLTVDQLDELGKLRSGVQAAVEKILGDGEKNKQKLLRRLQDLVKKGGDCIRLLITDQLLFMEGEGSLKDLVATPDFRVLVPEPVAQMLESFKIPDVFAVYGGEAYMSARNALQVVVSTEGEALDNAINNYIPHCNDITLTLQTMFFITTQESYKINQNTTDRLLRHLEDVQYSRATQGLARSLLQCELPPQITPGSQLSALVIHLYTALQGKSGNLSPLAMIVERPSDMTELYTPTMPDNPYEVQREEIRRALQRDGENPVAFKCPNGHIYFIGNCGRPVTESRCTTCRAAIGGRNHRAMAGNQVVNPRDYMSVPGHILGSADMRQANAVTERELPPLPCAILRCLVHLAMMASTLSREQQDILQMINPRPAGAIRAFLLRHINLDLRQIADCSGRSRDECYNLLHIIIHSLGASDNNTVGLVRLTNIIQRRQWEAHFHEHYLSPHLTQNIDVALHGFNLMLDAIQGQSTSAINDLLKPRQSSLDEKDVMRTEALWLYRRPITLSTFLTQLSNDTEPDAYPLLKKFLNMTEQLRAVNLLPSVLKLMKIITDRFHCRIERKEARNQTLAAFSKEQNDIELQELIDNYIQTWNIMATVSKDLLGERLSMNSYISDILPRGNQSLSQRLITYLVDVHNTLAEGSTDGDRAIPLMGITHSNLIALPSEDELIPMFLSNCEYELMDKTIENFDWRAIEHEVYAKYISLKQKITNVPLTTFQYPDDFNMSDLFDKISYNQARLSRQERQSLTQQYGGTISKLTDSLNTLEKIIRFICATPSTYAPKKKLFAYMSDSLALDGEYVDHFTAAVGDFNLEHATGLWTLLSFEKSRKLLQKKQEPFDDICNECCAALEEDLQTQMVELLPPQRESTSVLLYYLYEYIILKLNRSTEEREGLDALNLGVSLHQGLQLYLWQRYEDDPPACPELPGEVTVKHAVATWKLLCSSQQENQPMHGSPIL